MWGERTICEHAGVLQSPVPWGCAEQLWQHLQTTSSSPGSSDINHKPPARHLPARNSLIWQPQCRDPHRVSISSDRGSEGILLQSIHFWIAWFKTTGLNYFWDLKNCMTVSELFSHRYLVSLLFRWAEQEKWNYKIADQKDKVLRISAEWQ